MSDVTLNLRSLLKINTEFLWQNIHIEISKKCYKNETIVLSVDGSSRGLGDVIL